MARIGFIGLGNMGAPMARNLLKAGHEVAGFDVMAAALDAVPGARRAASAAEAAADADVVLTMLPASAHVRDAWLGTGGLMAAARPDALLMDCSTIDVGTAREVAAAAGERDFLDAPVSGGVMGAEAGTLTFMVGGSEAGFARARPVLEAMGRSVVHCGAAGAGQAAKLCNNMMLAVTMAVTCEAFVLAEKLGLSHQALFDVASKSSAQSWALTTYCPVPGPVPASPANRGYRPGFSAALMVKDLGLAQQSAKEAGAVTPFGAHALDLYRRFVEKEGGGGTDFSGIIAMIREGKA
ncbi:3-hydroxyisobutyrate dehydrogenase [Roseomonas alkaliterrae]|uniref:3-hydroxyisobutyrate dehydrogenase n=1 Tax=Neoroseomonas alkaliterrae TaxID=1452450 RepID=A0A840XQV8_9PROT|nr:3-hydroxyisobutyrate dehydrogenase [Neoroseomonas alkaliterrae]MBB5690955.1 3-hydroxyisobutyrate dehydrogenase [Neoroseomonas alkaliterrae]MBR0674670.1 3-hydroxyisobutyrate dehydrogenase [Neoroseomonas alkaliterrae]